MVIKKQICINDYITVAFNQTMKWLVNECVGQLLIETIQTRSFVFKYDPKI